MKLNVLKPAAATSLLLLAAGCGGKAPTEAVKTAAPEVIAPPTLGEMQARLAWAMDESIPSSEKQDLVQGSVADPQLVEHVLDSYRQEGAEIEVKAVTPVDAQHVTLNADLLVWDAVHPQLVPFVAEDGKWKVEKTYACGIVELLQMSSPAC